MSSENDPLPEMANLQISTISKRPNARTRRKKKKQNEVALNEIASRLTLRQFSCPFLDEFGTCVYDELPHRCQFSHPELVKPGETLMKIPFYVCVFHLIHICNFRPRSKKKKNNLQFGRGNQRNDEDDEYFCCNYGYHLKLPEMHDFQYKRPDLIVDLFGSDLELVCSICELKVMEKCFPRNRRFGLLENCFDVFCATCLIKHRRDDPDKLCPVCGVKSARMANHRCYVGSVYTKAKIFADGQSTVAAPAVAASKIQNNNTGPKKNGHKTTETGSNSTTPEPPSADLLPRPPKSLAVSTLLVPSTLTATSAPQIAQTGSGSSSPRPNSKINNANQCQICKQTIGVTSNGQQLSQEQESPNNNKCLFVMLENCSHSFCVDCIQKERRRSDMKCPICKLTSRRMVANSKYVPPGPKKTKLFAKLNGTRKKCTVMLEATMKEVSSSSTTTGQSRNLLCRICNRKVHSNPDNPNQKYGILENCWHVFCSSCINAKREEKEFGPRCPICSIVSERIYYRLEFVQSEDEKQKLFARLQNTKKTIKGVLMTNSSSQSSTSSDRRTKSNGSVVESKPSASSSSSGIFPNVADSQRICGICNLRVLSNPKNQDHQFGILENCEHVFCSSCIQPKRFLSPQCPVCKLTSRIVYHPRFFVSNDTEKRQLFAKQKKSNKVKAVSSCSPTPASGTRFDCRMCRRTFNIVPGGDHFVCLLENCSHIFCMQCICTHSGPFHCRECGVSSERFSIQSRLVFSHQEKLQIFQNSKRVDNFFE